MVPNGLITKDINGGRTLKVGWVWMSTITLDM